MHTLSREQFDHILENADIKPRLKKELKFETSTKNLPADWSEFELIDIADRTGSKGILLLQPGNSLYLAQYEIIRRIIDANTGRDRAIICDFCYTWQPGSNAASITFTHAATKHKIRFLCCGDLACSQHVRTQTKASLVSRSQLRESLSNEERVERLKTKLSEKIIDLGLQKIM